MSSQPDRATPGGEASLSDQRYRSQRVSTGFSSNSTNILVSPPHSPTHLEARQHIRRLRGGSQAHLMGCSDEHYYVVKFPGNPQGTRILANELLCAQLAQLLRLPVPIAAFLNVSEELISRSSEMYFECGRGCKPCQPGLCFGSRHPAPGAIFFDSWPRRRIEDLENISDFAGMLVFDLWTANIDFRQVLFLLERPNSRFRVKMFDNGFAFGGKDWTFKDKPRLALNPLLYVYDGIDGMNTFDPWLYKVEYEISQSDLQNAAREIPAEWYESDSESLHRLLTNLYERRTRVRELIWSLRTASPRLFPNWRTESRVPADRLPRLGNPGLVNLE